jgi:putative ABC transport system substrate-binding protein
VRRREFITFLGGATVVWPLIARAQSDQVRRIGVLVGMAEDDPQTKARLGGFRQGLERRGWSEGRNVRIDYRFAASPDRYQPLAKELIALQPDVILAQSTPVATALQRESREIPIVSSAFPTQSAQASSPTSHGRVAISPAYCFTRRALPASGWRCSRRSRRS